MLTTCVGKQTVQQLMTVEVFHAICLISYISLSPHIEIKEKHLEHIALNHDNITVEVTAKGAANISVG